MIFLFSKKVWTLAAIEALHSPLPHGLVESVCCVHSMPGYDDVKDREMVIRLKRDPNLTPLQTAQRFLQALTLQYPLRYALYHDPEFPLTLIVSRGRHKKPAVFKRLDRQPVSEAYLKMVI